MAAVIIVYVATYMDNPAGRLRATLEKATSLAPNTPAMQAWAQVFEIKASDSLKFFQQIARLLRMASEVSDLVHKFPEEDPALLLKHFDEVEQALAQFPVIGSIQIQGFISPLSSGKGLYCLEVCSSLLHRRCPEPAMTSEQRQALVGQVRDLISGIEEIDDLDRPTALWMKARLSEILQRLANADLFGTPELEAATDKLVGGLVRKRDRIASLRSSKISVKFIAFMVALDLALNIANNALEIGSSASEPPPSRIVIELQNELDVPLSPLQPSLPSGKEPDGAVSDC